MCPEFLIQVKAKDVKSINRVRIAARMVEGVQKVIVLGEFKPISSENDSEGEWLTKKQVAERLGVGMRTVQRWIASGDLEVFRKNKKTLRVRKDSLDSLLARKV